MARKEESEEVTYGPAAPAAMAGRPTHIVVFDESVKDVSAEFRKHVKSAGAIPSAMARSSAHESATVFTFEPLNAVACSLTEEEYQKLKQSGAVEAVTVNRQRFVMAVPGSLRMVPADAAQGVRRPRPARPSEDPVQPPGGQRGRAGARGETGGPVFPFGASRNPVSSASGWAGAPVFPFGSTAGPSFPFGSTGAPSFPFGPTGPLPYPLSAAAELIPYLAGQRDAVDALLARLAVFSAAALTPSAGVRPASGLTWGLTAIGITGATGELTGRDVKVAILDTGLDTTHPDWAGHAIARDRGGVRARSFVPGVTGVMDGHGHGTHTAGTLAGPKESVGGTRYGVAPECDLYVGKVLDDSGRGFDSDILAGIQWALTSGCRIISMSLGSVREPFEEFSAKYELTAQRVLGRKDGALIVAAAGNESARRDGVVAPVGNPAACPSVMGVAAVDAALRVADFSCGQVDSIGVVDLAAPGVGVLSSFPVSKGRFVELDGTSMATPHVAGVAACLLQADPSLTARQVWDRLLATARPLRAPATDVGRGLLSLLGR